MVLVKTLAVGEAPSSFGCPDGLHFLLNLALKPDPDLQAGRSGCNSARTANSWGCPWPDPINFSHNSKST